MIKTSIDELKLQQKNNYPKPDDPLHFLSLQNKLKRYNKQ